MLPELGQCLAVLIDVATSSPSPARCRFENFAEKRLAAQRHAPLALLTKGTDLAGLQRTQSFVERFQRWGPAVRAGWVLSRPV